MMKQRLLKTLAIGLLAMVGMNAWADGVNLLTKSTIKYTPEDGEESTLTATDGAITFTPGKNKKYTLKLTVSDVTLNTSQIYVVVEATANGLNTSTVKVRNITVGGTKYDNGSNTNNTQVNSAKMDEGGTINHMLLFLNPIKADYKKDDNKIVDAFATNDNLALTYLEFNLQTPDNDSPGGEAITIYNIGFYNVAEIIAKYPYIDKKWQLVNGSNQLRLENAGDANKVKVKSDGTLTLTMNEAKVLFKSMGSLTASYELDVRNLALSDATPFQVETMSNLSNASKVTLNENVYKYFPTVNTNLYIYPQTDNTKNRFRIFSDGSHPNGGGVTHDSTKGTASTTNWYGTYNRNLVAGYSSMMLPYEVSYTDLNAAGLTAYTFGSLSGSNVTFNKLTTGTITAHTPFIVKAETAGVHLIPSNGVISDWSTIENWYKNNNYAPVGTTDCYFIGSFINEVPGTTTGKGWPAGMTSSTHTFYGINSTGTKVLKMKSDTKTTYYRAFLAVSVTGPAPSLFFDDGNGTTDIKRVEDIDGLERISDGAIYNLQGVRMNGDNLPRGIYVRNGKKFVVK